METPKEKEMKMGENVLFIEDYMVWGHNVNGMTGMFYRFETSGNCLVYISKIEEWCEPPLSFLTRKSNGRVGKKNRIFCDRIKTMEITY